MGWTLPAAARGVWVKIPAVEVIEVLATAGVDFVVVDREHGAIDLRAMNAMIAVGHALGLPVFVRVPGHAPAEVQPALDAGASGVFVPHVDDRARALEVVDACRFPPLGHRHGSPTNRAGDWGTVDVAELVRRGNEGVMLVAQVETPDAVANIEGILDVAGVDAVFIGPFDLALSSGLAAASPDFVTLVEQVERAAAGRTALGGVAPATRADDLVAKGYSFVLVGADTTLLADSARELTRRGVG
ncbi:aldolase/citrate lyase family protein [Pseudonocardia sp. NPDC049635]|uniref:HpcH/HpaI aldolase family protein n=1 Tax=Pseudonocardia sp. NPDC049635 TaxID=3155506 RepID=UPI0033D8DB05